MKESQASFLRRFYIYQKERFPFLANGVFLTAFAFSAISYSRLCRDVEGFVAFRSFLSAAITTISFFFLLRIADEFKDREEDARFRPHLPVPRGLISFTELRWMAVVTLLVQVAINAWLTPAMLIWLVIPQFFLLMIANDFFVSDWLNRHWELYVLAHMFFFPAIDYYSSGMDWYLEGPGQPPIGMLWFFAVSYASGLVWEVGRKIRAEGDEEHNSYSRRYGRRTAVWIWMGTITLAFLLSVGAAWYIDLGWLGAGVLFVIYASSLVYGILFLRNMTRRWSRLIELASGGWGLFMYLTLGALPMIRQLLLN